MSYSESEKQPNNERNEVTNMWVLSAMLESAAGSAIVALPIPNQFLDRLHGIGQVVNADFYGRNIVLSSPHSNS
jgi:hypothetical protein